MAAEARHGIPLPKLGKSFRFAHMALDASPSDWRYLQGFGQLHHENGRLAEAIDMYASAMMRNCELLQPI